MERFSKPVNKTITYSKKSDDKKSKDIKKIKNTLIIKDTIFGKIARNIKNIESTKPRKVVSTRKDTSKKVINLSKIVKDKENLAKREKQQIKKEEKIKTKEEKVKINEMIEKWKDIMYQTKTYNQNNDIFTFANIKCEDFGFKALLYCPVGLTFKALDEIQDKIEDGLNCIFIYNKERLDEYMDIRIVMQISSDKEYNPPKTRAWEIYIGDKFDGTPIIVDLNKWCQVLLSGTTGGGKSKLLDCSIATQVFNHTPKDLELFLIQLDKCDLLLYKNATICKGFADDLDKAVVILEYLEQENKRRTSLVASVKQKGLGSNITDYNALNKKNKQPTIWVAIDEMASIAEKGSDSKGVKEKKKIVDDLLASVAQYGRSNNIFLISCLQRPSALLLNTFVKSLSNLKISFRQSNQKSSEISTDDSKIALDLPIRVAVFKTLAYDFLQTPFISDPIIMGYIKPKLDEFHDTIFDIERWGNRLRQLQNLGNKGKDKDDEPEASEDGKQDNSKELKLKELEEKLIIKQQQEKEKLKLQQEEILSLKQKMDKKEKEMIEKEKLLKQTEKLLEKEKIEQEKKIIKFKSQRAIQQSDTFKKVEIEKDVDKTSLSEEEINSIVETNKQKNKGWVDWIPPTSNGKEKTKK
jgi:hypothetical protein